MTKRSGSSPRKKAKESAATAAAAAAAVTYPPWVLLEQSCVEKVVTDERSSSSSSVADTNTLVAGHTAAGIPIAIALCVAAPPESSRVCLQAQPPTGVRLEQSNVLAAHGDSILIEITCKEFGKNETVDHFVYNAGDAAADPPRRPSLLLLPPLYAADDVEQARLSIAWRIRGPEYRWLSNDSTGLLRRGGGEDEGELVVAELDAVVVRDDEDGDTSAAAWRKEMELILFRAGEWSRMRLPMPAIISLGSDGDAAEWDTTRKVLPVGDRLLCWSDMVRGLIFCDVFDENPALQFVPFPVEPPYGFQLCVTSGGDSVKLMNVVFPHRCSCGRRGAEVPSDEQYGWSSPSDDDDDDGCPCPVDACTLGTWTLTTDDMTTWVADAATVDAAELWAQDAYKGVPRVKLTDPFVWFDDPDTLTFTACEGYHKRNGDWTVWVVTVDMRSKAISSVFSVPQGESSYCRWHPPMPSKVSGYLNG